ncbi:MAG: sulfite exporter TauE/SafE family protein [Myxococcota bacterium]
MDTVPAAYAQLLGLGLIWMSVHCSGMCGPILVGFDVAGTTRSVPAGRGALAVLTYQGGRALTYMFLGALAGWLGAGLRQTFHTAGSWGALAFAVIVLGGIAWRTLRPKRPRPLRIERTSEPLWERVARRMQDLLLPLARGNRPVHHLALGAIMGFLPCMIPAWVLGLGATTGSPLHGALLMLLLVVMTTPMLLGVTLLPRIVTGRLGRIGRHLPTALLGLSGVWIGMVGLAGLGVVEHVHLSIGDDLLLMLW